MCVTKMTQQSEQDVQMEIQKTLASINDITLKIKKELVAINDLVQENGRLNTAVDSANVVLSKAAKSLGIETTKLTNEEESEDDEPENFIIPITSEFITHKLMTIIHGSDHS